ncbi:hypothetical protein TL16_g01041 [Triparma laevis f. inornata]|uniref:Calcineurin-like phosphoesterase domain-containing protein n=1 Tax=Triparma laevis f. inornata TaxID=1714386 RepID=A0A9W6ZG11_9STRA|nr:hypothetical protein TL16_g01041 [Triparma laevis f. inornata]
MKPFFSPALLLLLTTLPRGAQTDSVREQSPDQELDNEILSDQKLDVNGVLSDCTSHSHTSCFECVSTPQLTDFGVVVNSTPCRFCPETQECHAYGSLFDGACSIPIHTNDVKNTDYSKYICDAASYPHIASDFSNTDVDALEQWVIQYLNNFGGKKHVFPTYAGGSSETETGLYKMADTASFAVSSDWGSGTWESAAVASLMKAKSADYTMHLGDVYYEALKEEIEIQVFGKDKNEHQHGVEFPQGSKGTFYLNANHEMLSLGNGYYDTLLPSVSQAASFFSLSNDYWNIVALDTGYNAYETFKVINAIDELKETDAPQPDEVVKWLNETLGLEQACKEDKRGLIFMSHHQPFSDFVKDDAYLGTASQLAAFLPSNCTVLWLTGHEHEFALYDKTDTFGVSKIVSMSIYHRLIGNGGFPQPPQKPSKQTTLKAYDNRVYKKFELNSGKTEEYVFNGYFTMDFEGDQLTIKYYSVECASGSGGESNGTCMEAEGPSMTDETVLGTEVFKINKDTGSVELVQQDLNDKVLTIIAAGEEAELEEVLKERQRWPYDDGSKKGGWKSV